MSTETVDFDGSVAQRLGSLTPRHWLGVALAATSGGIHLWLGLPAGKTGLLVAAAGFAVGVAAVILDVRRGAVVRLGIPFVAGQIILYALAHGFLKPDAPTVTTLGLVDKAIQLCLLAVLVDLVRRE